MAYTKTLRKPNLRRASILATETAAAVAVLAFSQILPASASANGTFYLTPASQTVAAGDNLTVTLYENSGTDKVNALQANLTYSSNLQYVSASYSSSAFSVQAAANGGNGKIDIARGSTTPVSGAHVVGAITFKAVSNGAGTVGFSCINSGSCKNGNALVSSTDNTNVLGSQTGGNYTISGTSSSGGTTTGTTGTGSSSGTTATGQTASADVTITVNDTKGKPISGATVTLNGQTAKTNQQGQAVFQGVPSGAQAVTVKAGGKTTKQSIQVAPATDGTNKQQFSLAAAEGSNMWLYGIIGLAVLILLAVFIIRRAMSRGATPSGPASTSASGSQTPPTPAPTAPAGPTIPQDPGNVITPENNKP